MFDRLRACLVLVALFASGCSRTPPADGLRDSFAQQLAANQFVSGFQRSGDTFTFKAPRPDGVPATWRVHIDTATIEKQTDPTHPYKGTVDSSWQVDGQKITPTGADSNLPIELTSNGLAQECWALWDQDAQRWSWE